MALTLITAPLVEPLTLAEVKAHLRIDHSEEDDLIEIYMLAARQWLEGPHGFLGRALVEQTWDLTIDGFPDDEIKIPLPPLMEVVDIRYDDTNGDEQIVSVTDYYVDTKSEPGWVAPVASVGWPTGVLDGINTVRIRFIAGYVSATGSPPELDGNIPDPIRAGMLVHIGSMYEHRESTVVGTIANKVPQTSEWLYQGYRIQLGMA